MFTLLNGWAATIYMEGERHPAILLTYSGLLFPDSNTGGINSAFKSLFGPAFAEHGM